MSDSDSSFDLLSDSDHSDGSDVEQKELEEMENVVESSGEDEISDDDDESSGEDEETSESEEEESSEDDFSEDDEESSDDEDETPQNADFKTLLQASKEATVKLLDQKYLANSENLRALESDIRNINEEATKRLEEAIRLSLQEYVERSAQNLLTAEQSVSPGAVNQGAASEQQAPSAVVSEIAYLLQLIPTTPEQLVTEQPAASVNQISAAEQQPVEPAAAKGPEVASSLQPNPDQVAKGAYQPYAENFAQEQQSTQKAEARHNQRNAKQDAKEKRKRDGRTPTRDANAMNQDLAIIGAVVVMALLCPFIIWYSMEETYPVMAENDLRNFKCLEELPEHLLTKWTPDFSRYQGVEGFAHYIGNQKSVKHLYELHPVLKNMKENQVDFQFFTKRENETGKLVRLTGPCVYKYEDAGITVFLKDGFLHVNEEYEVSGEMKNATFVYSVSE